MFHHNLLKEGEEEVLVPTTWNPLDKSTLITLSNGDLTASHDSGSAWGGVRTVVGKSSGTGSFEITYDGGSAPHLIICGISRSVWPNNAVDTALDEAYNLHDNGTIIHSFLGGPTILATGLTTLVPGGVFRGEIDFPNGKLQYFVNNVSQGGLLSFNAGTWFPNFYGYRTRVATLNAGETPFVNSPTPGITEGWG